MFRIISVLMVSLLVVSGCIPTETSAVHQITAQEANAIRLNQLDLVNMCCNNSQFLLYLYIL